MNDDVHGNENRVNKRAAKNERERDYNESSHASSTLLFSNCHKFDFGNKTRTCDDNDVDDDYVWALVVVFSFRSITILAIAEEMRA